MTHTDSTRIDPAGILCMPGETWRPIPGYEGRYEVSDAGRVRSFVAPGTGGLRDVPRIMRPASRPTGHAVLTLHDGRGGRQASAQVHALVLLAFVGPRPAGMLVLHGNDDPGDNRLANLRYGTPAENAADMMRNGTLKRARGEGHHLHVLTPDVVREARAMRVAGESVRTIARKFGISTPGMAMMLRGRTWAHVPMDDATRFALDAINARHARA